MGRKQACRDLLDFLIAEGHEVVGVLTDSHLSGSVTTTRAQELGVPVLNWTDTVTASKDGGIEFDLGLSMVFWRKIPQSLIDIAAKGIINFHPAPLPEYKGTAGYNLAILEGLEEWAVSAHYVDESIDTGAIIDVDWFPIDSETETISTIEAESMRRLLDQSKKLVSRISKGEDIPTVANIGGRYVSRQEMEEMKRIKPGDDVPRKIRAFWFPPYKGATVEIDGQEFTLVSDEILATLIPSGRTSLMSNPTGRK